MGSGVGADQTTDHRGSSLPIFAGFFVPMMLGLNLRALVLIHV